MLLVAAWLSLASAVKLVAVCRFLVVRASPLLEVHSS
jgi:hypothetical protein